MAVGILFKPSLFPMILEYNIWLEWSSPKNARDCAFPDNFRRLVL